MARDAYLFVDNNDPEFQKSFADAILEHSENVIKSIEKQHEIRLERSNFQVHPMDGSGRSPGLIYKQMVAPAGVEEIRFVLTKEQPSKDILDQNSGDSILLVSAFPSKSGESTILDTNLPRIALAQLNSKRIARFLEDLIIDITLANFFVRTHGVIESVVSKYGTEGLYREKVRYFHKRQAKGWLNCKPDASYVPLCSLLSPEFDTDEKKRAESAFEVWSEFIESLQATGNDLKSIDANTLRSLAKLGGQISVQKILDSFNSLPEGSYLLLIQKRSQVGKPPVTRRRLSHLFGSKSRPNSFRIMPKGSSFEDRELTEHLRRSGYLAVFEVEWRP